MEKPWKIRKTEAILNCVSDAAKFQAKACAAASWLEAVMYYMQSRMCLFQAQRIAETSDPALNPHVDGQIVNANLRG